MSQTQGELHDPDRTYQISRYPATLIDVWRSRTGERFMLRPVLPQDHRPLGDMIRRLSRATRHNRFHGGINELPADTLRSMAQVDYRRHLAFVITMSDTDNEIVVADARYVIDDRGDGAEFAIVVDDRWQRNGLGERAMHALVDAAGRAGLLWLHGSVLSANAPMLSLMQRCRFCCTPDREDDHLVHIETRLGCATSKRAETRERVRRLRWLASSPAPAPT